MEIIYKKADNIFTENLDLLIIPLYGGRLPKLHQKKSHDLLEEIKRHAKLEDLKYHGSHLIFYPAGSKASKRIALVNVSQAKDFSGLHAHIKKVKACGVL